ncbi:1876_t:CDS:2, partial [Acaulospora colombiana]
MSRKRRALFHARTLTRDIETNEIIAPNRFTKYINQIKKIVSRDFWEERFEPTQDETLVDSKLLSYAYLEAGLIEFIATGFTPADLRKAQKAGVYFLKDSPDFINSRGQSLNAATQIDGLAQAQSIGYSNLLQAIIGNKYNFYGILAGACLGMFVIYTPPLHVVFGGSYHLSPLYWLIPVAFGCLLLVWASIRVLLLRKSIEESKVKDIKGLRMSLADGVHSPDDANVEHPKPYKIESNVLEIGPEMSARPIK